MKAAINTQSQNEVKDLLDKYVVSPLNTDISTKFLKISTEIKELETSTREHINNKVSAIDGHIDRLQQNLSEIIDEKIEDRTCELLGSFDEIKTVLTQLKTDFKEAEEQINLVTDNNKQEIISSMSEQFKSLEKLFIKQQNVAIYNYNEEIKMSIALMESQQQTFIKQKYKILFAVSLSFGVINAIGLIVMIVLYLIK